MGMSLKARFELSKGHQLFGRKIPCISHRRVKHRANMTIGKNHTVSLRQIWFLRIMSKNIEIECSKNIAHAKRPCGVSRTSFKKHLYNELPDVIGNDF